MAHVVLFHSAQGLRPAVTRFADALRKAGHEVTTPDLFEGRTFASVEEGAGHRDALGIPELTRRAEEAVEALPPDVVYAGFSMGAASAEHLALNRPGARGVVLMHGVLPPAWLGHDRWPAGLPLEVHFAQEDPWIDVGAADALAKGGATVFRYPGSGHLFADEDGEDYDATLASTMRERVLRFLSAVDAAALARPPTGEGAVSPAPAARG